MSKCKWEHIRIVIQKCRYLSSWGYPSKQLLNLKVKLSPSLFLNHLSNSISILAGHAVHSFVKREKMTSIDSVSENNLGQIMDEARRLHNNLLYTTIAINYLHSTVEQWDSWTTVSSKLQELCWWSVISQWQRCLPNDWNLRNQRPCESRRLWCSTWYCTIWCANRSRNWINKACDANNGHMHLSKNRCQSHKITYWGLFISM